MMPDDDAKLYEISRELPAIDLDAMSPHPTVGGKGTHGGYCGPAVKPIALNMVSAIAADPAIRPDRALLGEP